MAKLKVAKTNSGTLGLNAGQQVDKYVSPILVGGAHIGGTGGIDSQAGNQIAVTVKVGANTAGAGSIITQKGAHKFRVTDGTHEGTCTLVDLDTPTAPNTMSIVCTLLSTSTFHASRITNKYVYDFAGNRYRYHLATATATFVQVASA